MSHKSDSPETQFILIRGLAREARHWGKFPDDLQRALAAAGTPAKVDAIDLPGSGRFSEMRSPITIPDIAEFVRGKFLEIRQRQREAGQTPAKHNYLVTVSLGGMVASSWIERWPDDFKGVVLINTSFKGFSKVHHRLSPPSVLSFYKIFRAKEVRERELRVLEMVSNRPEIREAIAAEWASYSLDRPVSIENFARQMLAASLYQPAMTAPPVPTLVLCSSKDRMVNPKCSEMIAERWNAEFRKHPTAGHDLSLDDAKWVVDEILSWRDRLS